MFPLLSNEHFCRACLRAGVAALEAEEAMLAADPTAEEGAPVDAGPPAAASEGDDPAIKLPAAMEQMVWALAFMQGVKKSSSRWPNRYADNGIRAAADILRALEDRMRMSPDDADAPVGIGTLWRIAGRARGVALCDVLDQVRRNAAGRAKQGG